MSKIDILNCKLINKYNVYFRKDNLFSIVRYITYVNLQFSLQIIMCYSAGLFNVYKHLKIESYRVKDCDKNVN